MGGPALMINPSDGIFIGDICGFILSLPIALFLVYWLSSVKRRMAVILGGFVGAFLGFFIILGWAGTLIYDTNLPNTPPGAVFFGSLLICSTLGLALGILADLIIARLSPRDYRRQVTHE